MSGQTIELSKKTTNVLQSVVLTDEQGYKTTLNISLNSDGISITEKYASNNMSYEVEKKINEYKNSKEIKSGLKVHNLYSWTGILRQIHEQRKTLDKAVIEQLTE